MLTQRCHVRIITDFLPFLIFMISLWLIADHKNETLNFVATFNKDLIELKFSSRSLIVLDFLFPLFGDS